MSGNVCGWRSGPRMKNGHDVLGFVASVVAVYTPEREGIVGVLWLMRTLGRSLGRQSASGVGLLYGRRRGRSCLEGRDGGRRSAIRSGYVFGSEAESGAPSIGWKCVVCRRRVYGCTADDSPPKHPSSSTS